MRRRQRGFSLVEMLVVIVLLGLIMVAALPVLDELIRSLGQSGAALAAGDFGSAAVRLRQDVHGAQAVGAVAADWTSLPLELRLSDGSTARYELSGQMLVREGGRVGRPPLRSTLLSGVASWQWRSDGRIVDIQVVREPLPVAAGSAGRAAPPPEFLRLGLRGSGGRPW
jgi:prepilin-type N-terminal cleavage/methylation domain-containing protein